MQQKEIFNPNFLETAGSYLEANGFTKKYGSYNENSIFFLKGDNGVIITNNTAEFKVYYDGEPDQQKAGYVKFMSLTGIGDLDLFKWMWLFHIAGLVPIKDFLKLVPQEDVVDFTNTTLANHKPNYPAIAI